jgi:hypothetical protein
MIWMEWKGFGRKQSWYNRCTIPEFASEELGINTKNLRPAGVSAEMRNEAKTLPLPQPV